MNYLRRLCFIIVTVLSCLGKSQAADFISLKVYTQATSEYGHKIDQDSETYQNSSLGGSVIASAESRPGFATAILGAGSNRDEDKQAGITRLVGTAIADTEFSLTQSYTGSAFTEGFVNISYSNPGLAPLRVRYSTIGRTENTNAHDIIWNNGTTRDFTISISGEEVRTVPAGSAGGFDIINPRFQEGDISVSMPNLAVAKGTFNSVMSLVWAFGDLPGEKVEKPLQPFGRQDTDVIPTLEISEQARGVTIAGNGALFSTPVASDFGRDNFIYFDPEFAVGYLYTVEHNSFSQFFLPAALPGGDDLFSLFVNGQSYEYQAGSIFDFTSIDPNGVSRFLLLGIDIGEGIDPRASHAPFVSGLKFMSVGLAEVNQIPLSLTVVPEPSSLALFSLSLAGFMAFRRCRQIIGG